MQHLCCLLLSLTVCFVTGCRDDVAPSAGGNSQVSSSDFAARLEAAEAIQNTNEHDNALADLAKDAAQAGEGAVTEAAVDSIHNTSIHDTAAAESAILLAKAGKPAAASAVAKRIHQTSLRDQTLATIARGD